MSPLASVIIKDSKMLIISLVIIIIIGVRCSLSLSLSLFYWLMSGEAQNDDLRRKRIANSFKTHQDLSGKNSSRHGAVCCRVARAGLRKYSFNPGPRPTNSANLKKIASAIIIDLRQLHVGIKLLSMESSNRWEGYGKPT